MLEYHGRSAQITSNDPFNTIILKYSNHPSILKTNQVIKRRYVSFAEIDLAAIEKELNDIDTSKVSKSSSIPPKSLKDNINMWAEPLVSILNKCILDGKFDDGLKLADLIPSHTRHEATNKKNYINISLLPVLYLKSLRKLCKNRFGPT